MLGTGSREAGQDGSPSFFPSPQDPMQAGKAVITPRTLLEKNPRVSQEKQEKIVKFSNSLNEKTILSKGTIKCWGMTLNQITLTHLEKEGESTAEERLYLSAFEKCPSISSLHSSDVCIHSN